MKKRLLALATALLFFGQAQAQRFVSEVFNSWTVTTDTFAKNYSFLAGSPTLVPLTMDVYQPQGDTMQHRPMVIILHTGNFLPGIVNQTPVGFRQDSATTELCRRFVKRGYVVANMDYRLGWNPQGSTVDIRRGTILTAIYRSVQDAHACVRYFHKDAATTNKYNIDSNKVILGGHGTGGYIVVNTICLKDTNQMKITKLISNTTVPTYGFVAGMPYVNWNAIGDIDGYGGLSTLNNANNSPGYGGDPQFGFNMGGCLADSSWVTAGLAPIVGFHETGNPYAPYGHGIVYVPSIPPASVIDVVGDSIFVRTAVTVGNNNCFKQYDDTAHDPFTTQARAVTGGVEGLYPFVMAPGQSGPWNWYDSASVVAEAVAMGYTVGHADTLIMYDKMGNNATYKAYSMKYIDTVMGYVCPRINACLAVAFASEGVNDITNAHGDVNIYPNPAMDNITVQAGNAGDKINTIAITDLSGRIVQQVNNVSLNKVTFRLNNLQTGMYFISVYMQDTKLTYKLIVK